jgi:hypothetical protein
MSENNDLTLIDNSELDDPITLNPIDLNNASSWEDFISLWTISQSIDIRNQWFKGDIANRVAIIHGESSLAKFAQEVGEKRVTIEGFRRVARAFPKDIRNLNLSWTHYFLASFTDSYKKGDGKFEGEERYKWVEKASDEGWSTTRLSAEIKKDDALVKNLEEVYDYYNDYLTKVNHVLLHIDKKELTSEQSDKLADKLLDIYNDFAVYLDIGK